MPFREVDARANRSPEELRATDLWMRFVETLLRRGRGYRNLQYLLLKAQTLAAIKTEFTFRKAHEIDALSDFCGEPFFLSSGTGRFSRGNRCTMTV